MKNQKEEYIIEVENLNKKFKEIKAVDNVSFKVKKGEIFAFLGPNGAGKTTTIRMLTTLLKPNSGKIMINGFDPLKEQHKVRSSFGIVFQDFSLDNELTALENLRFHSALYSVPKKLAEERIEYLLKLVDLWDRKNNFIKTYSGGMKRRLEIARGLIHHPKILFLDEPTLGLDPQTRNKMWDYVKKLNEEEGMTVFFTTHYMHEAEKYANKIAIIDHGKIIIIGTPTELTKKTKTKTLEEAFLKITGHEIREESGGAIDKIRAAAKSWGTDELKIKILGIGNSDEFNYIIIKKDKGIFNWLNNVMYNSFGMIADWDKEEYIDRNDKFVSKKKNINTYTDKHEIYEKDNAKLGIFYGKEKIFITVITSLKYREKLMKNLDKYSEFVKYKGEYKEK